MAAATAAAKADTVSRQRRRRRPCEGCIAALFQIGNTDRWSPAVRRGRGALCAFQKARALAESRQCRRGSRYSVCSGSGMCIISCSGQRQPIHALRERLDHRGDWLWPTVLFRSQHAVSLPEFVAGAQPQRRRQSNVCTHAARTGIRPASKAAYVEAARVHGGGERPRALAAAPRIAPSKLPPSALNKFPNGAQRFFKVLGRPVEDNLQLNAKPLGSVEAQRSSTEP